MRIEDFWLFKKYKSNIEPMNFGSIELLKTIRQQMNVSVEKLPNVHNTRINWKEIPDAHNFFFDERNNDFEISTYFIKSKLATTNTLLVETTGDLPVIRVETDFFISNWYDLTLSLMGMGCVVVSEDYRLLLEFTDDASYRLYSNFKIKPQ